MYLKYFPVTALMDLLGTAQVLAGPAFTVTASCDPFITGNTTISVTNDTTGLETNVVLFSGAFSELLGSIAPGATVSYDFNEISGPFIVDPGDAGLPDTTGYQVSATVAGQTLTSDTFRPVSNLTGGYVDFLGACYRFSTGCSVDPTVNFALTADVAEVPEPGSFGLLAAGLVALGGVAASRRRIG